MMLEEELQKIYDSEINIEIGWMCDGGVDVKLGDEMNGYKAQTSVQTIAEILLWLQSAVPTHYPDSTYIRNLGFAPPRLPEAAFCNPILRISAG